jgi:hypothetical protein
MKLEEDRAKFSKKQIKETRKSEPYEYEKICFFCCWWVRKNCLHYEEPAYPVKKNAHDSCERWTYTKIYGKMIGLNLGKHIKT